MSTRRPAPPLPDWIEAQLPAGIDRYSVEVGDERLRMHVMELGSGRPVLLVHGNPTWGFLYRKVASALAGEPLRLIMPDLIGLGLSDKPAAEAHQLDNHGRWLGDLVDALDLRGLILVGQDWGGPVGLLAVHARRDRLAGLVLLNTVIGPPRPGFKPTAFHRFATLPVISDVVFRRLQFPQIALGLANGDRRSISGRVSRAYRWPLRDHASNVAPLALARMVPSSQTHPSIEPLRRAQQVVDELSVPAAIVWGDRDPILGRVRSWVEKRLPDAEVTRTRAGHFLQEEVPDEIAAAIRSVAARAEPLAPADAAGAAGGASSPSAE